MEAWLPAVITLLYFSWDAISPTNQRHAIAFFWLIILATGTLGAAYALAIGSLPLPTEYPR